MKVVISQPMFVPWIGLFEQIRLADVFVHYDDVQMPQGRSFISRVQIKTLKGQQWMSAQVDKEASGILISETVLMARTNWRDDHINLLKENYRNAPYRSLMLEIAADIYAFDGLNLAQFNQYALEYLARWLNLHAKFEASSSLSIPGQSSRRLVAICKRFNATDYLTGQGALNYLDCNLFELSNIDVSFMTYKKHPYQQQHGDFNPHVTILDAIANIGDDTRFLLTSNAVPWRSYVDAIR